MSEKAYLQSAWMLVAVGAVLTGYVAMTPMVSIGYLLRVDILLLGLLPYAIYIQAAWLSRNALQPVLGALLVASQLWLLARVDIRPDFSAQDYDFYLWSLLATGGVVLVCGLSSWRRMRSGDTPADMAG
jgi:hypothetical protein